MTAKLSITQLYYWLTQTEGMGYKKQEALLTRYGNVREIYNAFESDKDTVAGLIGAAQYKKLSYTLDQVYLDRQLDAIKSNGLDIITAEDESYPAQKFEIAQKPLMFFYKGDLSLLKTRAVAIIGTRNCSTYGRKMTQIFAAELSRAGLTIVSGLATGIDSFAHRATLNAGGKTIAVLGNGHNQIYPSLNRSLADEIAQKGLVISEYPPGFKGNLYSYPARNRLISALSDGVLVIEAGEKSGTRYTVEFAAEQGRNIYCLPGNADSPKSRGNLILIRAAQCAMVFEPEHILEDLGIAPKRQKNKTTAMALDFNESKILDLLSAGALNYENILDLIDMPAGELNSLLTLMELKGLIIKTGATYSIA